MRKKLLSLALALVLALGALIGCDMGALGGDTGDAVDNDRTQLYVATYAGGWGRERMDKIIAEFEEIFKEESFEEGKKGVQVILLADKTSFSDSSINTMMKNETSPYDIFDATHTLRKFVTEEDLLMDISDMVKNTMTLKNSNPRFAKVWNDLGETESIYDKVNSIYWEKMTYAAQGSSNPQGIYGLPGQLSWYNLIYDVDLYYEGGYFISKRSYEADGVTPLTVTEGGVTYRDIKLTDPSVVSSEEAINADKSCGQDGVYGTEDDGLPRDIEEFTYLCNALKNGNVIPITWSGSLDAYRAGFGTTLWANYSGANDFKVATNGVGTLSDGTVITTNNGEELAKDTGRRDALRFVESVIKNDWYDKDNCFGSSDHTASQTIYLKSKIDAQNDGQRMAMFIEGNWWENEAKDVIDSHAAQYGGSFVNRRFGVMPYPWMSEDAQKDGMVIAIASNNQNMTIRKNAQQPELAQLFLTFCYTDKALQIYTSTCGGPKLVDYDLTEENLAEMTPYQKSCWNYFRNAESNNRVVFMEGNTDYAYYGYELTRNSFGITSNKANIGGWAARTDAFTLFQAELKLNTGSTLTADKYFEESIKYWTPQLFKASFYGYLDK